MGAIRITKHRQFLWLSLKRWELEPRKIVTMIFNAGFWNCAILSGKTVADGRAISLEAACSDDP
jgi:hypothetical protein